MNTSVSLHATRAGLRSRRTRKMLRLFFGFLLGVGFFYADGIENLSAYLLICCAAFLSLYIWVRMEEPGIPILPAVVLMHLQYYAFPILKQNYNFREYSPGNILTASVSVALYLIVMTSVWKLFVKRSRSHVAEKMDITRQRDREMVRLGMAGLCFGLFFQLALFHGFLSWSGSAYGVVRAVAFSLTSVSCFFIGVAWGKGGLRIREKRLCVMLTSLIILLMWSTLFLVLGVVWLATLMLGYFISSRRIPVFLAVTLLLTVFVLHAGKADMRDKYWGGRLQISSVAQVPSFYAEWVGSGVNAINTGEMGQSVFDRASLLQMLLRAQDRTPEQIDFLYGRTYAMLPALLVPRFLWHDKPTSQSTLNMLNIRYGLVAFDAQGNINTAIGWGVIAESYVNFGMLGIIGIGVVMGLLMGVVTRWSISRSAVSFPTLFAVASMVAFINLEVDFTYLCTILFQSFFAVLIFYNVFRLLIRKRSSLG